MGPIWVLPARDGPQVGPMNLAIKGVLRQRHVAVVIYGPVPVKVASSGVSVVHYNDVIMTTMASQITSLTVVYSTVYSDADQRKHQSSASLAFVWGINRDRWIPRTKGQLRGKCFRLMTLSWVWHERSWNWLTHFVSLFVVQFSWILKNALHISKKEYVLRFRDCICFNNPWLSYM